MLEYLRRHPVALTPEVVNILAAALDDAWQQIQASGATFDDPAEARDALAKLIVDLGSQGERDHQRLVQTAVARFRP